MLKLHVFDALRKAQKATSNELSLSEAKPVGHGRESRQRRGQTGDVRLHVREEVFQLVQDLVEDGVGQFVARQGLLSQVLVRLC